MDLHFSKVTQQLLLVNGRRVDEGFLSPTHRVPTLGQIGCRNLRRLGRGLPLVFFLRGHPLHQRAVIEDLIRRAAFDELLSDLVAYCGRWVDGSRDSDGVVFAHIAEKSSS